MGADIEFVVDKEHGRVTCKLYKCKLLAIKALDKLLVGRYPNFEVYDIPYMNDVYTGTAICAPEDEFDEEYGKQLALIRARNARSRAFNHAIDKVMKKLIDLELDMFELYHEPIEDHRDVDASFYHIAAFLTQEDEVQ